MGNERIFLKDSSDTSTGPSDIIWANCTVTASDPKGVYFFTDCLSETLPANTAEINCGAFSAYTGATAGSKIYGGDVTGGAIIFESTTDDEGCAARSTAAFKVAAGAGKLWFECRVKFLNITDSKFNAFIGLFEDEALSTSSPIATTDAMADKNFIGFQRVFADGDALDTTYKADGVTQVTVGADAVTVVADTFVKLGMYFDGSTLYFYKDGAVLADSKAITTALGTDTPSDVNLGVMLGLMLGHGDTASFTVDWVRCAQARAS